MLAGADGAAKGGKGGKGGKGKSKEGKPAEQDIQAKDESKKEVKP